MQLLYRRPDGTFVADLGTGPYHVIPDDPFAPPGLWEWAVAEAERLGDDLPFEPVPPVPTPEELLASIRATATIDRGPLCKALKDMGILSVASAIVAAKGDWPAEFSGFLSGLDADTQADAQIDWADATVIRYSNPLLQTVALNYTQGNAGQATALLDQLFGITAP